MEERTFRAYEYRVLMGACGTLFTIANVSISNIASNDSSVKQQNNEWERIKKQTVII
jgi:hypothetical protein